ncbi:hypothetical protein ACP4OV_010728 [Aristida adscensionis]
MATLLALALLSLLAPPSSAAPRNILPLKSSLVIDEHETNILQSLDGTFSCGFYEIYTNAFTFSIWYSNSVDKAVIWSANRGSPVHSWRSAITLRKDGNMVLTDYDGTVVWQTDGRFPNVQYAQLLETGNLVLKNSSGIVWQSFDSPTDTILPTQHISATTKLVSTTQLHVPGHYFFRFSDQSILSLIYDDTNVSGIYWPDPDYQYYENNRNQYNSTRTASLDDSGELLSSDFAKNQALVASDRANGIKRRLALDYDGNLRLYSLNKSNATWTVTWIAQSQPCMIHGLCGPYGICHYSPTPTCSCPPGYKMSNPANWTQGCVPIIDTTCDREQNVTFLKLPDTDYWGSDQQRINKVSLEVCQNVCKNDCTCKGFQYQEGNGTCYPKSLLFNGRTFPTPTVRTMYIKLPSSLNTSHFHIPQSNVLDSVPRHLDCDHVSRTSIEPLPNNLNKASEEESKWIYFYGFISAFFVIEVFFFTFAWFFVLRRELRSSQVWADEEGYRVLTSHFRMFSYRELVKATEKFKHELGWGSTGVVYKGILDDDRVVVVKELGNVRHSREEFQDELYVIARINHMNLVRIYGFCSERSHRMLVFEYAKNGSLADILFKNQIPLEWKQRFNIALGVAKGLAYLHHECLEWIIHCNLKPENILLDQNMEPKITDFGLAKLVSRSGTNQNVSQARGTKGYIAPEWISGLPITAKVDVYSYGVVLLELVSGTRVFDLVTGEGEEVHVMLKKFIKMISYRLDMEEPLWLTEFVDFRLYGEFNYQQAAALIRLAVSCLEEERKRRPTMESIVESLLSVDFSEN